MKRVKQFDHIYAAGRRYTENFFWEKYRKIERVYQVADGLFAVGTDDDLDYELLWGVTALDHLREGLKAVQRDYPRFIFRYAGSIETVIAKRTLISDWNYDLCATYVGYVLTIDEGDWGTARNHRIHRLKPSQLDEFLRIEEEIFHFPNLSRGEIVSSFDSRDRFIWVLMLSGRIRGFLTVSQHAEQTDCWLIRDLGVCRTVRHQGWGRKLLRHAVAELKHVGARKAMLWVDYDNCPARKLYEEVGFRLSQNEAEAIFAVGQ